MIQVRFWTENWTPDEAFSADPVKALMYGPAGGKFEVKGPKDSEFRLPKNGDTTHDIGVWCRENNYTFEGCQNVANRRYAGHWQGQVIATWKKKGAN